MSARTAKPLRNAPWGMATMINVAMANTSSAQPTKKLALIPPTTSWLTGMATIEVPAKTVRTDVRLAIGAPI